MAAISNAHNDVVTKLVPGGVSSLAHLSDQELLTSTRRLVGKSNQVFAALLLHLAEVEARGVHRARLCASLYTYCVYELRFSEDAAARRSSAARLVKQFPALLDAVAKGELHLTGLLMVGPHLTAENHVEVLGRAKFRTKKELAKLVRELHPLPGVPDLIEPLRPAPFTLPTTRPSWQKFADSWEPPVRELRAGERPGEWANDADHDSGAAPAMLPAAPARFEASQEVPQVEPAAQADEQLAAPPDGLSPAPLDLPPITGPQQYQMQFSTCEEHVQLVERAKALLARSRPGMSLGELHLEAMRLLLASLEKQKFAVTDRPRKGAASRLAPDQTVSPSIPGPALGGGGVEEPIETVAPPREPVPPAAHVTSREPATPRKPAARVASAPRQRGRYVPAAERREVFARDEARCTFTDAQGRRCCETRYLELHHLKPFAQGGENVASNLTLRCSAHNGLAAEEDFGREVIEQKRGSIRHESLAAQSEPSCRRR